MNRIFYLLSLLVVVDMKIGKYEITKGPNIQWYLITTFIIIWTTISTGNWWFIGWWIVINIVLIPVCFWIHKRNIKNN